MSDIYEPPEALKASAHVQSMQDYRNRYAESIDDPAKFWGEIAKGFHWQTPPTADKFLTYNFDVRNGPVSIKWMEDAVTNICYNCLDRHLPQKGSQVQRKGQAIAIMYWLF